MVRHWSGLRDLVNGLLLRNSPISFPKPFSLILNKVLLTKSPSFPNLINPNGKRLFLDCTTLGGGILHDLLI